MNFDLAQIARITGGRLVSPGSRVRVRGISTDSRTVGPGELFVPLRGETFDGHDFLAEAANRGAAACLSEEMVAGLSVPVILVENTLMALGEMAAAVRGGFGAPVVAVTGSSGKTTTKDMLASILSSESDGLKTEGNFNNLIGLPLTLFRLQPTDQWAVLEMGMSALGEIARLCEIARPQIGVLTNIGPAHLQTLHGLEGVARAKGELFAALPPGGTAIANADDERVMNLPVANGVSRVLFGLNTEAQVRAERIACEGIRMGFDLCLPEGVWPVKLGVPGQHNVSNALAASAAARELGVPPEKIVQGLECFRPSAGRMNMFPLSENKLLIDDSYNANPLSVEAALGVLAELPSSGRRIAVLGDMLELGTDAPELHRELGREAAGLADYLLALGNHAADVIDGALGSGMTKDRALIMEDHAETVTWLRDHLGFGDHILVKGSRGMRMDRICQHLVNDDTRHSAD